MSQDKTHIERNTVQETLIVPLYGRKMCAEKFTDLYHDRSATMLCDRLDYDFSEYEAKKDQFFYKFGALEAAMRQLDIMYEVNAYLEIHPNATIVNLGCGLDQTGRACDNGTCKIVNIDFPNIIEIRSQLIPDGDREVSIGCDLKELSWMDQVDGTNGVIFFAAGVFHYFKSEEVKSFVLSLAEHYPAGCLVFDTVGLMGLKLMMSKVLKNMGITDVSGYFHVENPSAALNWSDQIKVSSKGYMLGYYDMKSKGITWAHRLFAKIGDGWMKMAVHKMEF